MTHANSDFYTQLAPYYHLIYPDWNRSIEQQAAQLDQIIRACWELKISSILDVSCGIGTQCLGLAERGYEITASDLSKAEIERAEQETAQRNLDISFSVTDMRTVCQHHQRQFDLVIACDNAIPHLLTDADILSAFREFYGCIRPGGGCLISVRDYEQEDMTGQKVKLYGIREENETTYLIFQKWDCHGQTYTLSMYFVEDDGTPNCTTHVMRTEYYAIAIPHLMDLMMEAGFSHIQRIDQTFFQPIIIGTKTNA